MTKLTRERIEHSKKKYWDGGYPGTLHEWNALHDMALESLDRKGVVVLSDLVKRWQDRALMDLEELHYGECEQAGRAKFQAQYERLKRVLFAAAARLQQLERGVVVPMEPTKEMINAGNEAYWKIARKPQQEGETCNFNDNYAESIYKAMLTAAPSEGGKDKS